MAVSKSDRIEDARYDIFASNRVSDFLLDKDRLFAKATLSAEELKLYEQIYQYLSIDLPTPDLVIYLQAETKTLYERVMHRGIEMEKTISFEYLELLNETYKEFFFEFDRSPVLIVNSDYLDFQFNKSDYNLLLEKLLDYFNNQEGTKMYFERQPQLRTTNSTERCNNFAQCSSRRGFCPLLLQRLHT